MHEIKWKGRGETGKRGEKLAEGQREEDKRERGIVKVMDTEKIAREKPLNNNFDRGAYRRSGKEVHSRLS